MHFSILPILLSSASVLAADGCGIFMVRDPSWGNCCNFKDVYKGECPRMYDQEWVESHPHFVKTHQDWQKSNPEWGIPVNPNWIYRNEQWVQAHPSFLEKLQHDDVNGEWHGGRRATWLEKVVDGVWADHSPNPKVDDN